MDYEGNLNLIRVAEAEDVRRFVLGSIYGATADHPMELVRMRDRAEESVRRSRLDWVIVRPTGCGGKSRDAAVGHPRFALATAQAKCEVARQARRRGLRVGGYGGVSLHPERSRLN